MENLLIGAATTIRLNYRIPGSPPPPPSSFGYARPHKSEAIAQKMISLSREWFGIWMGFLSYLIAQVDNYADKSSHSTSVVPVWQEILLRAGYPPHWVNGLAASTVCAFDLHTPRAGIVLPWSEKYVDRPLVDWFYKHGVPIWCPWTKYEEEYISRHREFDDLRPDDTLLMKIVTNLLWSSSELPLAELVATEKAKKVLDVALATQTVYDMVLDVLTAEARDPSNARPWISQPSEMLDEYLGKRRTWQRCAADTATSLPRQPMVRREQDYDRLEHHWEDYFKQRALIQAAVEPTLDSKGRQCRQSWERDKPLKKVFTWAKISSEDEQDLYVRVRVVSDQVVAVFNDYKEDQRRYSSFFNEWDLFEEFGTPKESDDDDEGSGDEGGDETNSQSNDQEISSQGESMDIGGQDKSMDISGQDKSIDFGSQGESIEIDGQGNEIDRADDNRDDCSDSPDHNPHPDTSQTVNTATVDLSQPCMQVSLPMLDIDTSFIETSSILSQKDDGSAIEDVYAQSLYRSLTLLYGFPLFHEPVPEHDTPLPWHLVLRSLGVQKDPVLELTTDEQRVITSFVTILSSTTMPPSSQPSQSSESSQKKKKKKNRNSPYFHEPRAIILRPKAPTVLPSLPVKLDDLSEENPWSLSSVIPFERIHRLSDTLFILPLPEYKGVNWLLGVTSPRALLYVYRLVRANLQSHSVISVAHSLLEYHIPFRTLLRLPTDPYNKPIMRHFQPDSLIDENHVFTRNDFDTAMLRAKDILTSPVGRAAFLRGGILGRIAEEFLSPSDSLDGPSTEVTRHRRGFFSSGEGGGQCYWDDDLTENEIAAICGTYLIHTGKSINQTFYIIFTNDYCRWREFETSCEKVMVSASPGVA